MKKLTFTFIIGVFILLAPAQGQTLVYARHLDSINIEKDGNVLEADATIDRMLIAYNKTQVKIFQNHELTCWVKLTFKTCGKKVKLKRKTLVEMSNGDHFSSKAKTERYKTGDDDPGYFIGKSTVEFSDDEEEKNKLVVSYNYQFRYKGHGLAYD